VEYNIFIFFFCQVLLLIIYQSVREAPLYVCEEISAIPHLHAEASKDSISIVYKIMRLIVVFGNGMGYNAVQALQLQSKQRSRIHEFRQKEFYKVCRIGGRSGNGRVHNGA
jgi:hypothetical protein